MTLSRPPARRFPLFTSLMLSTFGLAASAQAAPPVVPDHAAKMARGQEVFTKSVRALLTDRCVKCHGGEKTRSGFDLTTREALLKGGDKGLVVVPGQAKASRLYRFVAHLDDPAMPPKEEKLSDAAVAQVAEWIDLGAPYDKPLDRQGGRQEADASDRRQPALLGVPAAEATIGTGHKRYEMAANAD